MDLFGTGSPNLSGAVGVGRYAGSAEPRTTGRERCRACGGNGGNFVQKKRYEPCGVCGGKGGKYSGKVWVPCGKCGGAGGKSVTTTVVENCKRCGGSGYA